MARGYLSKRAYFRINDTFALLHKPVEPEQLFVAIGTLIV